jgi:flavin-dependent dehydrogenase
MRPKNDEIVIKGAGPAGLTAAINLKKAGYNVTVYEKNNDCGTRFHGDFQGFENWSSKRDILDELRSMNIKTYFWYKPVEKAEFYDYRRNKRVINFEKPGFYLIQRGAFKESLDHSLKNQAKSLDIDIVFNKRISDDESNIIASGPKYVDGIIRGMIFKTSLERVPTVILDDSLAPKTFAYFLTGQGKGCLGTGLTNNFIKADQYLNNTLAAFKELFDIDISNEIRFTGYGNFFLRKNYEENGKLFVGEAAGLQDYMLAFGLRQAIFSGYFAAKSIIGNENYDSLIKNRLLTQLKTSLSNRFLYRLAGSKGYSSFLKRGEKINNPMERMHRQYNKTLFKSIIYPIAKTLLKK